LLLFPPAWHRIVEAGEDSTEFLRLVTGTACAAFVPFALSLGLDLFFILETAIGRGVAVLAGCTAIILALILWFGIELWRRRRVRRERGANATRGERRENTPLPTRITQMLTEARVILPGGQALLGFQLTIILTKGFEQLPESAKLVHAASLCAITLSVILLMAPAAYHRIVHEGEATAEFHRVGSLLIMAATAPLALGLCGDLYVVIEKIAASQALAIAVALLALAGFVGLWYVYPMAVRRGRGGSLNPLPQGTRYAR